MPRKNKDCLTEGDVWRENERNPRNLFFNLVLLYCIFLWKREEVENEGSGRSMRGHTGSRVRWGQRVGARGGGLVCKEKESAAMPGIYKDRDKVWCKLWKRVIELRRVLNHGVKCDKATFVVVCARVPFPTPQGSDPVLSVVGGKWMEVGGGRLFGYWLLQEGAYLVRCHSTSTVFSVDTWP